MKFRKYITVCLLICFMMFSVPMAVMAEDTALTRGAFVAALYNQEGAPAIEQTFSSYSFKDVADEHEYAVAIAWAKANGLAVGYGADLFGSDDAVTREQAATFLHRYAQFKGIDVSVGEDTNILSYDDAFDIAEWGYGGLQWACGAGVMTDTEGKINPQGSVTQSELDAMLALMLTE